MTTHRLRAAIALLAATLLAPLVTGLPTATSAAADGPLTNLAHLDFLQDDVDPPTQAGPRGGAGWNGAVMVGPGGHGRQPTPGV